MFLSGAEGNMAAAHCTVSIWCLREECFLRANTHLVVREFMLKKNTQGSSLSGWLYWQSPSPASVVTGVVPDSFSVIHLVEAGCNYCTAPLKA